MFNIIIFLFSSIVYSVDVKTKVYFSLALIFEFMQNYHMVKIGFLVILHCD